MDNDKNLFSFYYEKNVHDLNRKSFPLRSVCLLPLKEIDVLFEVFNFRFSQHLILNTIDSASHLCVGDFFYPSKQTEMSF